MPGIGLLNEKPLHASLKRWHAQPGDRFEVPVAGFVIDIVRDDLLIEIQTGSVAAIKAKLAKLVERHRVRLVYPIAGEKWIIRSPRSPGGRVLRRKSPKRGRWEDLFREMVSIAPLLSHPNFSLDVLLIKEEEVRRYEGKRRWRRDGWAIDSRRLIEVVERRSFHSSADWRGCLPVDLHSFAAGDLATALGLGVDLAGKMAYCLRHANLIEVIGRRGRANLYRVLPADPP